MRLLKDGIESRYLWKPMHLQPLFKKFKYFGENNSDSYFLNGLCLPSGSNLSLNDLNKITESINKIL